MFTKLFYLRSNYKNHRLLFILGTISIIFIIFVIKIIRVSLDFELPKNSFIRSSSLRRDIVDRNGKLLATSVEVASIFARPNKILDKSYAAKEISKILSLDQKSLEQILNTSKNFIWIKRTLDPAIAKQVFDLGIDGIDIEYEYKRLYPYSKLTSHIVGYAGIDNKGQAGIERHFDAFLTNYDISLQESLSASENRKTSSNVFETFEDNIKWQENLSIQYPEAILQDEDMVDEDVKYEEETFKKSTFISDQSNYSNVVNLNYSDASDNNYQNQMSGISKYFEPMIEFINGLTSSSKSVNVKSTNEAFEPLKLSLDTDIQYIVSEELDEAIKEFRAIKGCCIVVDPNTGEILSAVNKPDFDPHQIKDKDSLFPSSWYGLYEVGSVFKSLIFAAAIDSKVANLNSVYNIKKFNIGKYTIKDYHYHEKKQTLPEIFAHSSNIGLSLIAMSMNQKILKNYLSNFGLFDELKIELPEKVKPRYIKTKWENITISTVSYGYGMSITPMHFIQAMTPLVNGGNFFDLTLIKNRNMYDAKRTPKKVLNSSTSNTMNKLLRLVVSHGNANRANVDGLLVGGKTGTANKIKNKKYDNKTRVSSFVAVFPANKPKYLVYLLLDEPQGTKATHGFATAGFTAAPTVGKILSRIALIKGEKPQDKYADKEISIPYK